jgi:hypothetical protein
MAWTIRPELFAKAVQQLRPGKGFGHTDDKYETLVFPDETVIKPTEAEIMALATQFQAEYDALEYQRQRQPEYPPLGDLADAIYWQSEGDSTKMQAYLTKVAAVKASYPKE